MTLDVLVKGEPAPNFELADVNGSLIRLSDYYKKGPVVLSLLRGFFCMYCRAQLERMRDGYDEFKQRGAEILAIGPDTMEAFQRYWQTENIPFIGMPDQFYRVARMYRQEVNVLKVGRMPLNLVIDTEGNIRYLHYGASMMDIPGNDVLLRVIDEINASSKVP